MNEYDRLECKLIAVFRSDSITDKSIYRKGKIVSPFKSKEIEWIHAVNKVILEDHNKSEKKENVIQLKLIA